MKLYLIRHGRTQANVTYTYCGRTDIPLSEDGKELLAKMRAEGGYPDPQGLDVYTTGMIRTEQTLRILFGEIPHKLKRSFREMDFGEFEGRTYEDLKDVPEYQAWINGDHMSNVCPGVECGNIMERRVLRGLNALLRKGRDAMVVCHGGTIAIIFQHFFPDSGLNWYEIQPANGTGYMIEFDGTSPLRWERIPEHI
ncbi:MAG: histidine phosphatase family protein [Firmicutes bacterium]|nr:histidine phosphatase family protein [Bacillota bacterium]